jgi:hypothetical protein
MRRGFGLAASSDWTGSEITWTCNPKKFSEGSCRFGYSYPTLAQLGSSFRSRKTRGAAALDLHFHMRRTPEQNATHPDGCGVSNAHLPTE